MSERAHFIFWLRAKKKNETKISLAHRVAHGAHALVSTFCIRSCFGCITSRRKFAIAEQTITRELKEKLEKQGTNETIQSHKQIIVHCSIKSRTYSLAHSENEIGILDSKGMKLNFDR